MKIPLFDSRNILAVPAMFRLFINMIGYNDVLSLYAKEYVRPKQGDRVVDIGCGLGKILEYLPQVEYVGFDMNQRYIETATKRFGNRGIFICKKVSRELIKELSNYDIVLATGILHHLDDDEAMQLFEVARAALKSGGRLITFDGSYVDGQSRIARFILSKDRGRYVRTREQYFELASRVFTEVKVNIHSNLLRIPYTHIIMECIA